MSVYRLDVALIHVSPPDHHGFCSLGASVDCTRSAVQQAKYIIGMYLNCLKVMNILTLLHSEQPKLLRVLTILSAIGLIKKYFFSYR